MNGIRALSLSLLVWFLFLSPSPAGSQAASVPSFIHFTSTIPPTRYILDHNTAQIGALRHQHFHSRAMHTPGLTIADEEMKSDFGMETLRRAGSRVYQVWTTQINVGFSYNRMDVYISSQYGQGSCPFKAIFDHENQHVAINTQALQKYAGIMKQALENYQGFPTKDHPWKVGSVSKARSVLKKNLLGILNPIFHKFAEEVIRENAKIDTPENYKRTQALCRDW